MCCQDTLLEEFSVSCATLQNEDSQKLLLGFHQPFPCADFALSPCPVSGLSCGCGSLRAPGSPSKSSKPGMILGTPTQGLPQVSQCQLISSFPGSCRRERSLGC